VLYEFSPLQSFFLYSENHCHWQEKPVRGSETILFLQKKVADHYFGYV